MRAYCENCASIVVFEDVRTRMQEEEIRGVRVTSQHQYAVCPVCGGDVYPNSAIDFNVMHAHDAYRKAVGSITSGEIMNCKWYHGDMGICCNADCPACADYCPCANYMEICKFSEKDKKEVDDNESSKSN